MLQVLKLINKLPILFACVNYLVYVRRVWKEASVRSQEPNAIALKFPYFKILQAVNHVKYPDALAPGGELTLEFRLWF